MQPPLPALNDEEGERLPAGLRVIDAHVHLFPDRLFDALWSWFEQHAWPIRYKLRTPEIVSFFTERGVERICALPYAHKPGMAASLNEYMAGLEEEHVQVWALGTVLPGEPDTRRITRAALEDYGLRGIKLHCHVQAFGPDEPRADPVYEEAGRAGRPVVIHAGREPASEAYPRHPHEMCSADAMRNVLQRHPDTTFVVPHLGADEIDEYTALLETFPNLYLDTAMLCADYFPVPSARGVLEGHPTRILYGTDFPNLPYAWDRELRRLLAMDLDEGAMAAICAGNAEKLFG